jgi:hypothetical protein
MTAVNASLVAIAVWLALNPLCLAIWLSRALGLRKTEEAGPVTGQNSPSQLPLSAETVPLVPSSQPEGSL